jgi:hypothetical protein
MEPASSTAPSTEPPVACSLDQRGLAERWRRWRSLAERSLIGVAGTRDGLRLTFAATPGAEAELRDLAGLETDCCAFASWTVRLAGDTVVLDVAGTSPEAVAAVQEMFTDLRDLATTVRHAAARKPR